MWKTASMEKHPNQCDLDEAQSYLPDKLKDCLTAIRIQAFKKLTKEQQGLRVPVKILPEDLETLLVSGFVEMQHLHSIPKKENQYWICIVAGELEPSMQNMGKHPDL